MYYSLEKIYFCKQYTAFVNKATQISNRYTTKSKRIVLQWNCRFFWLLSLFDNCRERRSHSWINWYFLWHLFITKTTLSTSKVTHTICKKYKIRNFERANLNFILWSFQLGNLPKRQMPRKYIAVNGVFLEDQCQQVYW